MTVLRKNLKQYKLSEQSVARVSEAISILNPAAGGFILQRTL